MSITTTSSSSSTTTLSLSTTTLSFDYNDPSHAPLPLQGYLKKLKSSGSFHLVCIYNYIYIRT